MAVTILYVLPTKTLHRGQFQFFLHSGRYGRKDLNTISFGTKNWKTPAMYNFDLQELILAHINVCLRPRKKSTIHNVHLNFAISSPAALGNL